MKIQVGSTDQTLYFKLTDTSGAPALGLTITDLDLVYIRDRSAAVKADLTALAAVDSAHADSQAIEVHATYAPGTYRVDVPDAAFATGVNRVQVLVVGAAIDPAIIECELVAYNPFTASMGLNNLAAGAEMALTSAALAAVKAAMEAEGTKLTLLEARLTAARALFLDNLNVGGLLASQADVQAIAQAQRVRIALPSQMERPDADSTTYRVYIYVYNELHQAEDLDANPTVTAENNLGTDRSGNLGTVTKAAGTGVYYVDYTIASTHAIEGLVFKVTATEGTVATQYPAAALVVDTTAVDFTSDDRAKLLAIHGKLPSNAIADQTLLLAAITAVLDHVDADWYIDTTTTPWSMVMTKKGDSATVYCRKALKDISGGNLADEDTIIASQTEVA